MTMAAALKPPVKPTGRPVPGVNIAHVRIALDRLARYLQSGGEWDDDLREYADRWLDARLLLRHR